MVGIDIFNGRKLEDVCPASHGCEEPVIKRTELQLINVADDGYLTLMDELGNCRDDLKLPDENEKDETLSKKIKDLFEQQANVYIVVLAAMNIEKVIDCSEKTN